MCLDPSLESSTDLPCVHKYLIRIVQYCTVHKYILHPYRPNGNTSTVIPTITSTVALTVFSSSVHLHPAQTAWMGTDNVTAAAGGTNLQPSASSEAPRDRIFHWMCFLQGCSGIVNQTGTLVCTRYSVIKCLLCYLALLQPRENDKVVRRPGHEPRRYCTGTVPYRHTCKYVTHPGLIDWKQIHKAMKTEKIQPNDNEV